MPALIALFEPTCAAVSLKRATEVVGPDRHAESPREIVEDFVGAGAVGVRLHGLQSGVAQRQVWRRLATSCFALLSGRWCRSRGASSASSPDCDRFSPEPVQSAFSDFQLIELVAQLCPFCIDPREPLGNPSLLLSDLVQHGHQ